MPHWFDRLWGREMKSRARVAPPIAGQAMLGQALMRPGRWDPQPVEAYTGQAIVHRCVRLIAEGAAAIPFQSAHRDVLTLLSRPNPDQSGPELWENLYGYLQLAGNAYLELIQPPAGPAGLYGLRPDRMQVKLDSEGWPNAWEYRAGRTKRVFERDGRTGRSPVFHIKLFHPGDDVYGLSPLRPAGRAMVLHSAITQWAQSLVDNAARPSGALILSGPEGRLNPDQFDRLKAELAEIYGGAANAGRPLLLEGGLDWKPMGLSPAEMDFSGARQEAARDMALALGVPPLLLGLPGDNTYANYREANLAFTRQTLIPLVRKMAAALTVWLAPWYGEDLEIRPRLEVLPDPDACGEARHA